MAGIDEFGLIARLFAPLAADFPGALGLKDDAALLDGPAGCQWVVTADAIVAGVHFLADDPPEQIARKLIRVNLSDLAAKGATPMVVLLAACFPADATVDWLDRFAAGLKADCQAFGISLIGGDTVATPGPLTLSLTALGQVPAGHALLRSQARPGDDIWVSGSIGDAALGLTVAKGGAAALAAEPAEALLERYRVPSPRLALGRALVGMAHAAMDVSDGLVGDLGHICEASGVAAEVRIDQVPLSAAAQAALAAGVAAAGGGGVAGLITGGDDYELLFTAPPAAAPAIAGLGDRLDLRLTRIGRIIGAQGRQGGVAVVAANGSRLDLSHMGYRHFGA